MDITSTKIFSVSPRLVSILNRHGIYNTNDLCKLRTERDLTRIRYIGRSCVKEIKDEYKRLYKADMFTDSEKCDESIPILNQSQYQKILVAKNLYDQLGTLEEVAKILNITRERVRQLLNNGERHNLFRYELTRKKQFKDLISRISKEDFINAINLSNKNYQSIAEVLHINFNEYCKLVKHYGFDLKDYRVQASYKRYLDRYSQIVEYLGHHPSTTEMLSRSDWRSTSAGISRLWGGFRNFRKEYGIERPRIRIHPNTSRSFKNFLEMKKQQKNHKLELIVNLLQGNPLSVVRIAKILCINKSTLDVYMRELVSQGKVHKMYLGRRVAYSLM